MKRIVYLVLISTVVLFASTALAGPGRSGGHRFFPIDEELRQLHHEATALALIHDLELTTEQRSGIKEILGSVRPEFESAERALAEVTEREIKPRLRRVIAELEAGRDPRSIEGESSSAFSGLQVLELDLRSKADEAYESATALLTPEQRDRLDTFDPHVYTGFRPGPGPSVFDKKDPMESIRHIRDVPQEEFDRFVEHLLARGPERNGKNRQSPGRMERKEALVDLMMQVRSMSQEDFDRQADKIQEEIQAAMPRGRGGSGMRRGGGGRQHLLRMILFSETFIDAL